MVLLLTLGLPKPFVTHCIYCGLKSEMKDEMSFLIPQSTIYLERQLANAITRLSEPRDLLELAEIPIPIKQMVPMSFRAELDSWLRLQ